MFDIGWSEMAVVVVIALLILGPKQLPEALRTITQFTRKARRYAQDFRSGIDNIVREAELEDARKALNSVRSTSPSKALQDMVDPTGEVDKEMRSLEAAAKEDPKTDGKAEPEGTAAAPGEAEKSIEAKAPETKAPETKAPETKAPETKAPETKAPETKATETAASEEPPAEAPAPAPAAKIVKEPLNVAPAHSIRPPPGEDQFAATPAPAPSPEPEPTDVGDGAEPKEEERRQA